jgi:hypothetical protein
MDSRISSGQRPARSSRGGRCTAEVLEELSKGRIEFIHHSRHGKIPIKSAPARSGDCHSSSAAAR